MAAARKSAAAKKPPSKNRAEPRTQKKRRDGDHIPDFRDLIENSVQGILVHRNFKPLYANTAFARLFGYRTAGDILALPLIRPLFPAPRWAQLEEEYGKLIRGREKPVITRVPAVKKDGSEIWLSITERVIDWFGAKAVQINAFDISDQMAIEHRMLESEQHLRTIFEVLPYPIYIARHGDGKLLFVNRKTCLLFQKSAGQLLREKSLDFFVDPKEREDLSQMLHSLRDIRDVEVKMKTSQGREFTAEIAAILMDYAGAPAVLVALNDISQRKQLEAALFHEASTDSLTGVNNRRYFLTQAEQELRRSRRFGRDLSIMMIDLDHFKSVNDRFGHATGDAVLQGAVKKSLESLRQSDQMGRLGGEEFAVILPETDLKAAVDVANRLRLHLAEKPVIAGGKGATRAAVDCTVSIGIAQLETRDGSIDDLLHRADQALYRAKELGRNRVEIAS